MNPHNLHEDLDFTAIERELRRTFAPVDPPAGFADRVVIRSRQAASARVYAFPARRVWVGSAIAAMLLAGVAGRQVHRLQQRHKAEEAQRQFELALQVTGHALQHARYQLQRAGVSLEE